MTNPPKMKRRHATDKEKEEYLFNRRNVFTHQAGFMPLPGESFGGGRASPEIEYFENYWTSTRTHNWPLVLEKAVRIGLAQYLREPIQVKAAPKESTPKQ